MSNFGVNSILSSGNSTSAALTNGSTFTGTGELNNRNDLLIQVKADQTAAVYADFSTDVRAADDTSAPFGPKRLIERLIGVTGERTVRFTQLVALPEKTDVWVSAIGPSGGAAVVSKFELTVVGN